MLSSWDTPLLVESLIADASWSRLPALLSPPAPWLAPLVHRLPPLTRPITAFLAATPHPPDLLAGFTTSMAILFPLASRRMSIDGLADVVHAIFAVGPQKDEMSPVFEIMLREYNRAFGVASVGVKKKVHNNFVQNHLHHWINAVISQEKDPLRSSILSVGIETLLCLDVLRFTEAHDSTLVDRLGDLVKHDHILQFLPIFYASYVQAVYRHRAQLFNHARDGFRNAACSFLNVLLTLVEGNNSIVRVWTTRLNLLGVFLEEGGYVRSGEDAKDPQEMLTKVVTQAVAVLEIPLADTLKPLAVQSLSTIIRIDYDILKPFVPQILTHLLVLPLEKGAYIEFLDLLLECHIKTRTLDELVGVMLNSIWKSPLSSQEGERQGVVVEDDPFLDRLGKAIGSFGTVGQCMGLVGCVSGFIERALGALDGMRLRFELGARIVCVVLACLNFEMVSSSDEGFGKLREVKASVDRAVRSLSLFEKVERELECGFCALLRVKYVFDQDVFGGDRDEGEDELFEGLMRLLECDREESLLPELVFELVRTMFLHVSRTRKQLGPSEGRKGKPKGKGKEKDLDNHIENERFFDTLLLFIERYYPRQKTKVGWSGTDCDLTSRGKEGKIKCAIAIVWMIVERWLGELDSLAAPSQIRRFLDVVFAVETVDFGAAGNGLVKPEGILSNVLHSAWFWEFGRIRKELVELLKERTSPLSSNRKESDMGLLKERISTFGVLLYFPLEYFSFQVLGGFVGCAVEVDGGLVRARKRVGEEEVMKGLVVLRTFVRRVCVFVGGGGVLDFRGKSEAELLLKMLEEPVIMDCGVKEAYLSASLDLAGVWLMRLFKSSKRTNDPEPVLRVLKVFNLESICGNGRGLIFECFIRMVGLLDREVGLGTPGSRAGGVHEDVLDALRVMRDEVVEGLYGRVVREEGGLGDQLEDEGVLREFVGLVRVWDALICLERCVGGGDDRRFVADKLVSVLMPHVQLKDTLDGGLADLCIGVFGVMLGEVERRNSSQEFEGRLEYLEVVLAIYVSWANKVSASGIKEMDVRLGRMTKRLAVSDFEHLLSFIAESLSDAESGLVVESRLVRLVHVGSLLVREHPSHSMACFQKFMARCLGLFNDNPVYVEGDVALRHQVLEMVGQYCSDQQAALRAQDTSLIWLLISKFLAPSQVHDPDTQTEMFHKIVSVLMCLIRLRRDLVALGLPHLGLILRRMIQVLRGCRPNLGVKQLGMVMGTQPRWISHVRPLGGEEAKALSRVLESLTLKTTVRVTSFHADGGGGLTNPVKAESLAKPFSKHAAYVLKAYVEVVSDPLCVVGKEVREGLREPGIFAVCGMMSEYGRDALMVGGGLGVGGKGVLKAVWKEWEGVRYVGKG